MVIRGVIKNIQGYYNYLHRGRGRIMVIRSVIRNIQGYYNYQHRGKGKKYGDWKWDKKYTGVLQLPAQR